MCGADAYSFITWAVVRAYTSQHLPVVGMGLRPHRQTRLSNEHREPSVFHWPWCEGRLPSRGSTSGAITQKVRLGPCAAGIRSEITRAA